jgi:hypothetical protein
LIRHWATDIDLEYVASAAHTDEAETLSLPQ